MHKVALKKKSNSEVHKLNVLVKNSMLFRSKFFGKYEDCLKLSQPRFMGLEKVER
jgi:hypothetical protein